MSSIVTINGKTYNLPSSNVSVIGNKVYCNGKLVEDCDNFSEKEINIVVEGNNNTVSSDGGDITVIGDANNASTKSGDIEISGNANNVTATSGDIVVHGNVNGNCNTTSGDIETNRKNRITNWFDGILKYFD